MYVFPFEAPDLCLAQPRKATQEPVGERGIARGFEHFGKLLWVSIPMLALAFSFLTFATEFSFAEPRSIA
jgi:hypothetical protein